MQVWIPVAYNVCEVKLDKIPLDMCTHRRFSSCVGIIKHKLKVGSVIGCAKPLNQAILYSYYKKANKYVQALRPKFWTSG